MTAHDTVVCCPLLNYRLVGECDLMALWVLTSVDGGGGNNNNQGYVNLGLAQHVYPEPYGNSGIWIIQAYFPMGAVASLEGTWSSQTEAMAAVRKLLHGVDPGDY